MHKIKNVIDIILFIILIAVFSIYPTIYVLERDRGLKEKTNEVWQCKAEREQLINGLVEVGNKCLPITVKDSNDNEIILYKENCKNNITINEDD